MKETDHLRVYLVNGDRLFRAYVKIDEVQRILSAGGYSNMERGPSVVVPDIIKPEDAQGATDILVSCEDLSFDYSTPPQDRLS